MEKKNEGDKACSRIEGIPAKYFEGQQDRVERQLESVRRWIKAGCNGSCVAFVGFGKTNIGLFAMRHIYNQVKGKTGKDLSITLIVPSDVLSKQWKVDIMAIGLGGVVNIVTMKKAAKDIGKYACDLLVIDEIHLIPTPSTMKCLSISAHWRLGLTGTYERTDGKHKIVKKMGFGIVDEVTLAEGVKHGWTANHNIYRVLCSVECDEYREMTKEMKEHFGYFNFNFDMPKYVIGMRKDKVFAEKVKHFVEEKVEAIISQYSYPVPQPQRVDIWKSVLGRTIQEARAFFDVIRRRKSFIYKHPKKLELTRMIIESYKDKKGITFSGIIDVARSIGIGDVYDSENTTKKNKDVLNKFLNAGSGVINTVNKLNQGFNCPEIEYAIMVGFTSSKVTGNQKIGRTIRINELTRNKNAKIFYIVLEGTRDEEWFRSSIEGHSYLTILEDDLQDFLDGKEIEFAPNRK